MTLHVEVAVVVVVVGGAVVVVVAVAAAAVAAVVVVVVVVVVVIDLTLNDCLVNWLVCWLLIQQVGSFQGLAFGRLVRRSSLPYEDLHQVEARGFVAQEVPVPLVQEP